MSDIGNKVFEAIETVVGQRLSEMKFDTTIIGTIVDDADKDKGHYRVKNSENFTFDAYCNAETKYSKNNQVYVLIPQGDYSNEKTIINRYSSEGETAIAFVPTADRILKDSDASLKLFTKDDDEEVKTIYANFYKTDGESYEQNGKYISIKQNWLRNSNYSGFNSLNIKADIQSSLKQHYPEINTGTFGIQIVVYAKSASGNLKRLVYKFNSNQDMYGDPYAYYFYGTQEQNFNFNPTDVIQHINVYLYQNQNFKNSDGTKIEYNEDNKENNVISFKNIEITFGHDVIQAEDKTAFIYTQDSLNYTVSQNYNNKSISLAWFNKDDEKRPLGFTDGDFDLETGKNTTTNIELNKAISGPDDDDTGIYYCVELYRNEGNGEWQRVGDRIAPPGGRTDGYAKWTNLKCHTQYGYTEFKAIVYRNGVAYESNIIKFVNISISTENINPYNLKLIIKNEHNSQDAYPVYGSNNQYFGGLNGNRQVSVSWESVIGAQLDENIFAGCNIYWYLPNATTMLSYSSTNNIKEDSDDTDYLFEEITDVSQDSSMYLENYRCFTRKISESFVDSDFLFNYMIKSTFNPSASKNTILVKIKDKNGNIYEGSKSFAFSSKGNSGTGYSLIFNHEKGLLGYVKGMDVDEYKDNLTVNLYDPDLKLVKNADISLTISGGINSADTYNIAVASTTVNVSFDNNNPPTPEKPDDDVVKQIQLTSKYPIAWTPNKNYSYEGPVDIIYSSNGVDVEYYNGPLRLFDENFTEIEGLLWKIKYFVTDEDGEKGTYNPGLGVVASMPVVMKEQAKDDNGNAIEGKFIYKLKAPSYYTKVNNVNVALLAKKDGATYWYQPLVINQFAYGLSVLNSWDGNLNLDEKNNRLLAATIVAGEKDDNNRFTGVVMGQPERLDSNEKRIQDPIGLYGYSAGVQSFGFKEDGTAFIGSGQGRIKFDGNEGVIESANYDKTNNTGSYWNLTTGDLYLGDENSYFKFDKNGLKVKAKTLEYETVSQSGGNLLRNSLPPSTEVGTYPWTSINGDSDNVQVIYHKTFDSYVFYTQEKNYDVTDANQWWGIEQVVKLKPNTNYTVFSHMRHRTPGQEVLINVSYYGLKDALDENNNTVKVREAYDVKKKTWGTPEDGDVNGGWGTGTTTTETRYGFSFTTPTEDELTVNNGSGFYRICFYSRCQKERAYKFDENGEYVALTGVENDNNTIFADKLTYKSMQIWKPCLLEGVHTNYIWQQEGINLNNLSTEIIAEAGKSQTTVSATAQIYDYPKGVDSSKVLLYIDAIGTSPERQYPAAKYLNRYALNQADSWLYYSDGQSWKKYGTEPIKLITAELSSQIEQLPHKITLKVDSTENEGPSIQIGYKDKNKNWVSAVDETTDAVATINLTGLVTFSSLTNSGKTEINGDNIKTGTITSTNGNMSINLNTGEIKVKNLNIISTSGTNNLLLNSEPRRPNSTNSYLENWIPVTVAKGYIAVDNHIGTIYPHQFYAGVGDFTTSTGSQVTGGDWDDADIINTDISVEWGIRQDVELKQGKTYTMQGWLRRKVDDQYLYLQVYEPSSSSTTGYALLKQSVSKLGNGDTWDWYQLTFTTKTTGKHLIRYLSSTGTGSTSRDKYAGGLTSTDTNYINTLRLNMSFRLWHPKLEEGSFASTWSASPSDFVSEFNILDSSINAKVSSKTQGTSFGWNLTTSGFQIYKGSSIPTFDSSDTVFLVKPNGDLIVRGTVYATGGTIGGWDIYQGYLGNGSNYYISTINQSGTICGIGKSNLRLRVGNNFGVDSSGNLYASNITVTGGSIDIGNNNFKVTDTGVLTCTGATVQGVIRATGGWINGNLLIQSTGSIELSGGIKITETGITTTGDSWTGIRFKNTGGLDIQHSYIDWCGLGSSARIGNTSNPIEIYSAKNICVAIDSYTISLADYIRAVANYGGNITMVSGGATSIQTAYKIKDSIGYSESGTYKVQY